MLVVVVFVLRLNVALFEVFVLIGGAAHARRFLGLGGKLERDLESRRTGWSSRRWRRGDGGRGELIEV